MTELDALRTEVLLSVSHELRGPLTSILGFAHLLKDGADSERPADRVEYLDIIGRNADRLLRIVSDLLVLGRLEAHTLQLDVVTVDVPGVVDGALAAIKPEADRRHVRIERRSVPGPSIEGDPERLRQMVDNLLSNAVKYSRPDGVVRVADGPDGDRWHISVADQGIGIPAGDQPGLFEKFARASNARERGIEGSGLGLAIVRRIAELHGGSVTLASEEGKGSTFTVAVGDATAR